MTTRLPLPPRAAARRYLLLLLPLAFAASCTVCLHPERNIWLVDETYEGKTVQVKTGDWVRVVLPTDPASSRVWQAARAGDALETDPEAPREEAVAAPGAPGRVTFPFRARRPGVTELTFRYLLPHDPGALPARTLHVIVFVP